MNFLHLIAKRMRHGEGTTWTDMGRLWLADSWRQVRYRFGNVGIESDVAHAFSVLCWHSCRNPTAQQKGRRTNETYRQQWRHGTPGGVRHLARMTGKFCLGQLTSLPR